jgi:hypothetical protein
VFRLRLQFAHQLGHGPGFHLAQDVGTMDIDRFWTQCERAHNRFAVVSFHQERQHFRFAQRQMPKLLLDFAPLALRFKALGRGLDRARTARV